MSSLEEIKKDESSIEKVQVESVEIKTEQNVEEELRNVQSDMDNAVSELNKDTAHKLSELGERRIASKQTPEQEQIQNEEHAEKQKIFLENLGVNLLSKQEIVKMSPGEARNYATEMNNKILKAELSLAPEDRAGGEVRLRKARDTYSFLSTPRGYYEVKGQLGLLTEEEKKKMEESMNPDLKRE